MKVVIALNEFVTADFITGEASCRISRSRLTLISESLRENVVQIKSDGSVYPDAAVETARVLGA